MEGVAPKVFQVGAVVKGSTTRGEGLGIKVWGLGPLAAGV